MDDPIVQEVRRAREAYGARFNYDLAAMVADLQSRTEQARRAGRQVVSLPPRPAVLQAEPAKEPTRHAGRG